MSWTLHIPRGWTGVMNEDTFAAVCLVAVESIEICNDGGVDVTFVSELDGPTARRVLLWARLNDDEILSAEFYRLLAVSEYRDLQIAALTRDLADATRRLTALEQQLVTVNAKLGVKVL